jgi:YQGE family putative transporter
MRNHGRSGIDLSDPAVNQKTKLNAEAKTALFIHSCFQFGASMAGLFLNLYLWRLTKDLAINGWFNLIVYALTPVGFAIGGWIAKKRDRMLTYRLGVWMIAAFYLLVVVSQAKVAEYYAAFAVLSGLATGLYWTGYSVLQYDVTDERNRSRYMAVNMIAFNAAWLAGPALAGTIIGVLNGLQGYIVTFGAASALFALASIVSFRIRSVASQRTTYYLRYSGLMMRKNRLWLRSLISFFVFGCFQGLMLFMPNILLYQTIGKENEVGYWTVLFSLLTIMTGFAMARMKNRSRYRAELALSSAAVALGAAAMLLGIVKGTVLVYMIVFSLFNPLTINTITYYYYRMMDALPLKGQFRIESVVVRELFLNAGRVFSIVLMLVFSNQVESMALPVILIATALLQLLMIPLVKDEKDL